MEASTQLVESPETAHFFFASGSGSRDEWLLPAVALDREDALHQGVQQAEPPVGGLADAQTEAKDEAINREQKQEYQQDEEQDEEGGGCAHGEVEQEESEENSAGASYTKGTWRT